MFNVFPTICVDCVPEVRDFYCEFLGFEVIFDSGWYVQLGATVDSTRQIGVVERSHASVPHAFRRRPQGVLVSIELDDVDEVYRRMRSCGREIVLDLRNEDFGQRHFMTTDPAGTLVDIISQIPPTDEMTKFGLTSVPEEQ